MKKLILMAWMATMIACAPTNNIAWHQRLQDEASYENRKEANEAFTLKSAKESLDYLKEKQKQEEKKQKDLAKIQEINRKIEELKKNN